MLKHAQYLFMALEAGAMTVQPWLWKTETETKLEREVAREAGAVIKAG